MHWGRLPSEPFLDPVKSWVQCFRRVSHWELVRMSGFVRPKDGKINDQRLKLSLIVPLLTYKSLRLSIPLYHSPPPSTAEAHRDTPTLDSLTDAPTVHLSYTVVSAAVY